MVLQLEKLVLRFQTHAYHKALVIVHQRKSVIEALADDLVQRPDATVSSARLNEALQQEPHKVEDSVLDTLPFKHLIPETVCSLLSAQFGCSYCCCVVSCVSVATLARAIMPPYLECFRTVLSIFEVSVPIIQRDCAPLVATAAAVICRP